MTAKIVRLVVGGFLSALVFNNAFSAGNAHGSVTATPTGNLNEYVIAWSSKSNADAWNAVYLSGPGDVAPYTNFVSGASWVAGSATVTITADQWLWWSVTPSAHDVLSYAEAPPPPPPPPEPTGAVQASKFSEPLSFQNDWSQPLQVEFIDTCTGDTLQTLMLDPGERWLGKVETQSDCDVQIKYTLPQGGAILGPDDATGALQSWIFGSGASWNGNLLDDSSFEANPPSFQARSVQTTGMPATGGTMDPAGPAITSRSKTVTDGTVSSVQFSEAAIVGGATDKSLREGFSATVQAVDRVRDSSEKFRKELGTAFQNLNEEADRITAAIEAGKKFSAAEITSEQTGNQTSLNSASAGHGTSMASGFDAGKSNAGKLDSPSSGGFPIIPPITIAGQVFSFDPFEFWPSLETYAHMGRELLLWAAVFAFAAYGRKQLERYMAMTLLAPQLTTKGGPAQTLIPGVGLAKQLGVAAGYVTVFIAAIAVTIGLINSGLTEAMSGVAIGGVTTSGAAVINSVIGSGPFATIYGFLGHFFPFGAIFQLLVTQVVFSWSLPGIWGVAYSYSKFVHP
jgi:hypothetical protein